MGKKTKGKKDDDDDSGADEHDSKEPINALSAQMQQQQDYQQLVDASNNNNSQPIQGSSTDTNAMQNLQQLLGQQNVEFTPRTSMVLAATIFGNQQLNTPAINSLLGGAFNNVDMANISNNSNNTTATNFESKQENTDPNGLKRSAQEAFDQNANTDGETNEGQQTAKKRKPNLTIQAPSGPQIPMKRVDDLPMDPPSLPLQTTAPQHQPTIQTELNMPNASGFTPMSSGGISAFINNNPLPTPSGVAFESYYDTLKGSTDNKQEIKKEA